MFVISQSVGDQSPTDSSGVAVAATHQRTQQSEEPMSQSEELGSSEASPDSSKDSGITVLSAGEDPAPLQANDTSQQNSINRTNVRSPLYISS